MTLSVPGFTRFARPCLTIPRVLVLVALGCSFAAAPLNAQEQRYEELAHKLIQSSARVKPGELVVISGGKHTIPLMEAIAIEAQKAGGIVQLQLTSDRVARARFTDMPEQYLDLDRTALTERNMNADVLINLPASEDPKSITADVPTEKLGRSAKAPQMPRAKLDALKARTIFCNYPVTKEAAAAEHVDYETYDRMIWAGINTDYTQIAERGNRLKDLIQSAKQVRITNPAGTDLQLALDGRPVHVNGGVPKTTREGAKTRVDRNAALPGGLVFVAPVETSVSGKVVIVKDTCRFEPLVNASFSVRNGKMQDFKADEGADCVEKIMAQFSGTKDMFGGFGVGLNPDMQVTGDYYPPYAAGLMFVFFGNNEILGGNNRSPGNFGFNLAEATMEVDGKPVVKDGKLVF